MKRLAHHLGLALGALGLSLAPTPTAASERPRPNILILLADDLGYADLGFQGGRDVPTPHIDALAGGGVRCSSGYVSGPYCSPTRAGLLTGRYQQRFGHEFNPGGEPEGSAMGLPVSETSLVERFREAGYVTGLVGKWHLGASPEFHPLRRGFDEFYGFLGGSHAYFPGQGAPIYRGTEAVQEDEYLTDAIARESVAFVDRHQAHPFLLEVSFNAVHTPMDATDDRLARFASISDPGRRTYAAMLAALDEAVGSILDAVRAAGLERDTLVFFLSDNGGPTMPGTTINASRNDPLRGSKRTTLEGGIRVPFVVSWPGNLPEGVTYDEPVIQLDILPTALAAAGVEARTDWELDGVDILPALRGEATAPPHPVLYWRLGDQSAIRKGDWKLVRYDAAVDTPGQRSIAGAEPTPLRLYNLADDISESVDLATKHPETFQELLADWQAWNAELAEPLWGPAARVAADAR